MYLYGIGCERNTTTLVVHGSLGYTGFNRRAPISVSQIDMLYIYIVLVPWWCIGFTDAGSLVHLVHQFTGSPGGLVHWFTWCTGSLVHLVHWFTGTPCAPVHLVHWFTGALVY